MLEDGSLIRLYPINFRDLPRVHQFKKYQWVIIDIEKNQSDPREESHRVSFDTEIIPVGEPISGWKQRFKWVLKHGTQTMCELQRGNGLDKSLGIVKPSEVISVKLFEESADWPKGVTELMKQVGLFGTERKPLEKIPFSFKMHFRCENPSCNTHTISNIDWEVYQRYRNAKKSNNSTQEAAEEVRAYLEEEMCGSNREPFFYVGNMLKRLHTWQIVGIMWPKKGELDQTELKL